jgi:hypothetical protein
VTLCRRNPLPPHCPSRAAHAPVPAPALARVTCDLTTPRLRRLAATPAGPGRLPTAGAAAVAGAALAQLVSYPVCRRGPGTTHGWTHN